MTVADGTRYHAGAGCDLRGHRRRHDRRLHHELRGRGVGYRAGGAQHSTCRWRCRSQLETDGKLPSGQSLVEAIERVDAETDEYPVYYMINCAHPSHFEGVLDELGPKLRRVRGPACECLAAQPRRTRRVDRSGCGRSGHAGQRIPRVAAQAARVDRRGRLLWNGSSARRGASRRHDRLSTGSRRRAVAAFNASIAAMRRRRSSWPICSPERPVRSSAVSATAAARRAPRRKNAAAGSRAVLETRAAARVRLAGQQEIREAFRAAQRIAALERFQHRVRRAIPARDARACGIAR